MDGAAPRSPGMPPPWFVRLAWRVHRALYRLSGGRSCGPGGVPPTLQHDDLHDANVFVSGNRHRFFDWGDASVAHPFISLRVARHLREQCALALRVGPLQRALTWRRSLRGVHLAVRAEWADAVPGCTAEHVRPGTLSTAPLRG